MWLSFSWSTLSGTGNMYAEENSVTPMCDLDGRPKMNRMTFVLSNLEFLLHPACCTRIPHCTAIVKMILNQS